MSFRTFAFNHLGYLIRHAASLVKVTRFSLVRRFNGTFMDPALNHITYIPIAREIEAPPETVVPLALVEHFINEASYHKIIHHCMCRKANNCTKHDQNLGCMFLGEGAREIDQKMGREISRDEALEIFNRAVESGLVPGIGQAKADGAVFGVKVIHRLMTVCFCCDCCCISRALTNAPDEMWEILVKLDGVTIERNENCIGCGECASACIYGQIIMDDGHPVIGEKCKGCGRCVPACQQKAIVLHIDNPDYINQGIAMVGSTVSVT